MIIGYGANQLGRRITTTINNGALTAKELSFLAAILHRIERYGDQAFITDAQASWLYTILTLDESGASGTNIRKPSRSSHSRTLKGSSQRASTITSVSLAYVNHQQDEKPDGFDITEALLQE